MKLTVHTVNPRHTSPAPRHYPETYLHVQEMRSGEEWIVPIGDDDLINLEPNVDRWIAQQFGGELRRDGDIMRKLDGDYYGKIMTDGRAPDSLVCWDGGGFYLTSTE